jgi:hypothetical protein
MLRKLAGNYFVPNFPLESNIDGWLVPGGDGIPRCYSKKKSGGWGKKESIRASITVFSCILYSSCPYDG